MVGGCVGDVVGEVGERVGLADGYGVFGEADGAAVDAVGTEDGCGVVGDLDGAPVVGIEVDGEVLGDEV